MNLIIIKSGRYFNECLAGTIFQLMFGRRCDVNTLSIEEHVVYSVLGTFCHHIFNCMCFSVPGMALRVMQAHKVETIRVTFTMMLPPAIQSIIVFTSDR